ncbi:MAG: tetratricopeptide repeat protein [Planctomycetaceae bacterium]|nr:tetratricopeptide repeat protein [Planctomycetaceae bacterium]
MFKRVWFLQLLWVVLLWLASAPVSANEELEKQFPPTSGTADEAVLKRYLDRVQGLEKEVKARRLPGLELYSFEDDRLAFYFDAAYFAQYSNGQNQIRFLLGRFVVINKSEQELRLKPADILLKADGREYPVTAEKDKLGFASFRYQDQHHSLTELEVAEELIAPPGQVASCWLVYNGIDAGANVPELELNWKIGQQAHRFPLNQQSMIQLKWTTETLGPHGLIAIGHIAGEVDPINLGGIVDEMVLLTNQDVIRMIIQFDEDAPAFSMHLGQWFVNATIMAQRNQNSPTEFPLPPPLIGDVHVVFNSQFKGGYSSPSVHQNLADAYVAACNGIYDAVSLKDLLHEVRKGHPLSRAAALAFGAIRLQDEVWPDLVQILDESEDAALRVAATRALREFPSEESLARLHTLAISDDEQLATFAIDSLASSRFPGHHLALLKLLQEEPERQMLIVRTMARVPRKEWADTLYAFASHENSELRLEVLQALNVVGHPGFPGLLAQRLEQETNTEVQVSILRLLSELPDEASHQLAIQFCLNQIAQEFPTAISLEILTRFQVQEAIPRLISCLNTPDVDRSQLIDSLRQISGVRLVEPLLKIYPNLNANEQSMALRAVANIDMVQLMDFADQATSKGDQSSIGTLINLFQASHHPRSIEAMISMYEHLPEDSPLRGSLLSTIGTTSSSATQKFLIHVRDNSESPIKEQAINALNNMYNRSPVNHMTQTAQSKMQTGNTDLAIKQFTLALDYIPDFPRALEGRGQAYQRIHNTEAALADYRKLIDIDAQWPEAQGTVGRILSTLSRFEESLPFFEKAIAQAPDAEQWYSQRGHVYWMLERFELADADFRKALELNPESLNALTGSAMAMASRGQIDEAVALLEKWRKQHGEDQIFSYNAACTYARAVQYLTRKNGDAERINELVNAAFAEIEKSIQLGYTDAEWARNDPDLLVLRDMPRFAELLTMMAKPKPTPEQPTLPEPDQPEDDVPKEKP